jgi:2-iminobutanoate/2-iminopropanoate deaminase
MSEKENVERILPYPGVWKQVGDRPGWARAVKVGNLVFLGGEAGIDKDGKIAGNTVEAQTEQIYKNIKATLEEIGASFEDIVMTQLYIRDMKDWAELWKVHLKWFGEKENWPASTFVEAKSMVPELLCEIWAIAVIPEK